MTSEDDTNRDGVLSYPGEWHALALGTYDGMKTWRVRPKEMRTSPPSDNSSCEPNRSMKIRKRDNEDVQKESHYYAGGYVIGTVLQLCIVAAVGLGLL